MSDNESKRALRHFAKKLGMLMTRAPKGCEVVVILEHDHNFAVLASPSVVQGEGLAAFIQ